MRVWDLEMDMMCRRTLRGHTDDVTHLSLVTPGGLRGGWGGGMGGLDGGGRAVVLACSVFASSSVDGTVRLW